MAHLKSGREIHRSHLAAHRLDDLRPAMARVHAPQPGAAVEDLAAVVRPVMHAFGAHHQPRRLPELAICRKRHPEGGLLERLLRVSELSLVFGTLIPLASL